MAETTVYHGGAYYKQKVCNNCGVLLWGKNGTTWVKKPHISIKGRISAENLGDADKQYHVFVSKEGEEETAVCDGECLDQYVKIRKDQYLKYRESKLRAEANDAVAHGEKPIYHKNYYPQR